ncbi:conserved hypothetical protein [Tenacibaculum sediminilitoris]|uniref:hypothetical protein n=1 Tax=Tenacibaculum sediminilitoris TaxID=1820334 RepID=UPI0038963109
MKKVIILLLLLLASTTLIYSQELNSLISGKWFVTSMKVGNEKIEFLKESSWLEFSSDGKYEMVINNKKEEGTWKLIKEKKELEFDNKSFESNLKIEKINKKELLVSARGEKNIYTMWLKR